MPTLNRDHDRSKQLESAIREFQSASAPADAPPIWPGHRIPFQWPPHPESYNFHVLASDWRGSIEVQLDDKMVTVLLAHTPYGVFGKCEAFWVEARGKTVEEMVENLEKAVEPLFTRQRSIAQCLGLSGRFEGHFRDLSAEQCLRLLYCPDRDVANDARIALETMSKKADLLPALQAILCDQRHPYRRSAQWCVLDLFEDLPSYCIDGADEEATIDCIRELIIDADDDYARAIFKAGVVLGGHLPDQHGGPALLDCLSKSKKWGRRAAIHGLFHVVEWDPHSKDEVVQALRNHAETEPDSQLKTFAEHMANDIESESMDHINEPIFPEEEALR